MTLSAHTTFGVFSVVSALAALVGCAQATDPAADGDGDGDGGGENVGGASGGGMGVATGSGGGWTMPPCTIDPAADPYVLLQNITIQGGKIEPGLEPEPYGGSPVVDNGGCDVVSVHRGEAFILPFRFTETSVATVGQCDITILGAQHYIAVYGGTCDAYQEQSGDIPLIVNVDLAVCPGDFTLYYNAAATDGMISDYVATTITLLDPATKHATPPETCPHAL